MTDQLTPDTIVSFIADIFARRGAEAYLGEPVTISEHMLQCAELAEKAGASDALVAAALLHDIGHFTNEFPDDAAEQGIDSVHEEAGAKVLRDFFPDRDHRLRPPSRRRQALSLRHRSGLFRPAQRRLGAFAEAAGRADERRRGARPSPPTHTWRTSFRCASGTTPARTRTTPPRPSRITSRCWNAWCGQRQNSSGTTEPAAPRTGSGA